MLIGSLFPSSKSEWISFFLLFTINESVSVIGLLRTAHRIWPVGAVCIQALTLTTLIIYKEDPDKMKSSFMMKNIYRHNKLLISTWVNQKIQILKECFELWHIWKGFRLFQTQKSIQDIFQGKIYFPDGNTSTHASYIATHTPDLIHYTLAISTQDLNKVVISWGWLWLLHHHASTL